MGVKKSSREEGINKQTEKERVEAAENERIMSGKAVAVKGRRMKVRDGNSALVGGKLARLKVWQLVVLLVAVIGGTVLFLGAVGGWFGGSKVTLDAEYYCGEECDGEMMELSGVKYEELVRNGGSFVVFVDQSGCTTAERLRGYVADYAREIGVKVYRMMFSEMKETSLHDFVKYYPSVAVVSRGRVVGYLRADSDEDADIYNSYEIFKRWIKRYL